MFKFSGSSYLSSALDKASYGIILLDLIGIVNHKGITQDYIQAKSPAVYSQFAR